MTDRDLTKTLYLHRLRIEMVVEQNWVTKSILSVKYNNALQIPSRVFKRFRLGAKNTIDNRRLKRYNRIRTKGATTVKPSTNMSVTIKAGALDKLIADMGLSEVVSND